MKSRDWARFDSKWWERNKAKTLRGDRGRGLTEALRAFEIELDRSHKDASTGALRISEALNKIKAAVKDTKSACNRLFHRETLAVLGGFEILIQDAMKRADAIILVGRSLELLEMAIHSNTSGLQNSDIIHSLAPNQGVQGGLVVTLGLRQTAEVKLDPITGNMRLLESQNNGPNGVVPYINWVLISGQRKRSFHGAVAIKLRNLKDTQLVLINNCLGSWEELTDLRISNVERMYQSVRHLLLFSMRLADLTVNTTSLSELTSRYVVIRSNCEQIALSARTARTDMHFNELRETLLMFTGRN